MNKNLFTQFGYYTIMEETYEIKTLWPLAKTLPFIIFIEGFVSISVEILTIRQLLPVAGGSVIVTSLIIGVFLLFLSLGYRRGGKAQKKLQSTLLFNFFISALWLGVGLSYLFVFCFFYYVQTILKEHVIYPLIMYLLFIISPLIYKLGQTIPITMNMIRHTKSIGAISGDILGLNTLGSFLGAVVTSLIFMQYMGVAWTVVTNVILLMVLILLLTQNKISFIKYLISALFMISIMYIINIKIEKKLFILTNNYANYQILQSPLRDQKILSINNSNSSIINQQQQGALYIEAIKKILFYDLKLRHTEILVLGAGGFTLTGESTFNNDITYVDIDSRIKKVAVPQFVRHLKGKLIVDDARNYIRSTRHKYTAIVIDVYTHKYAIPTYLLTQEYFLALRQKLTAHGIIIFNMIINPLLKDNYSKHVDNTIRAVFKNCMVQPLAYENIATNVLYICSVAKNEEDRNFYTDDLNTSMTESFDW